MLRFYFVRHGQTVSNIQHTLQGYSDTPLTDLGIQQGKQACERMKTIPFLSLYSSPSPRAYGTANLIKGDRLQEVIKLDGLREMNFGTMEGQPELFDGCEDSIQRIGYDWHRFGGETIEDVTQRLKDTLQLLADLHKAKDGNLLCVAHGFSILAAVRAVDEKAYENCLKEENFIRNCAAVIITYEDGMFAIEEINTYLDNVQ